MKDRVYEAVKYRLEEKAQKNPYLLLSYMNEDDRDVVCVNAYALINFRADSEEGYQASGAIEYRFSEAMQQYIDDNYQSELAEYRVEAAEAEAEHRRDQMMDERAERGPTMV